MGGEQGSLSLHPWEGNPLINRDPEVVEFNAHRSEIEAFETSIRGLQSLLKDGVHFIHGRGTPL